MNMKKNLVLSLLAILPLFSPINTEAQENVTEINPHEKKTEVMTEAKREKRLDELLQDIMIYGSDKNIENIEKSARMNFIRWNVLSEEENNKVAEVYGDTSYESQISWLTDWIRMRAEWIEEEYSGKDQSGDEGQGKGQRL